MERADLLALITQRLGTRYPDARYELDWKTPEQLLVATILAGGSRDAAVNEVTPALFARWPDPRALAAAKEDALAECLRPLGLGAQKAQRLKAVCRLLVDRFDGQVPATIDALTSLPGVGRKTANVVLTEALGLAEGVVVDTHVTRVAQRLGLTTSAAPQALEQELMALLPREAWLRFGATVILHGRYVCTARSPQCGACPLAEVCPRIGVPQPDTAPTVPSVPAAAASPSAWPEEYQLPPMRPPPAPKPQPPATHAPALPDSWRAALASELDQPYFAALQARLAAERAAAAVFPPAHEVFSAFHLTPFEKVRVVILGQDPYHGEGQAHGLAFSVKPGIKPPPSLVNVFKELKADLGCEVPATGCLEPWARQGILLLNACLTVRSGEANSHKGLGWEQFTDAVIRAVSARTEHAVFVLWGAFARKKAPLVDTSRHTVVEGAHPSPLSARQWFGSRPFSKIDAALAAHGQPKIEWQL